jgi:hypothetical protein
LYSKGEEMHQYLRQDIPFNHTNNITMNLTEINKKLLSQFNNPKAMTIADDLELYKSNARYRELHDKDERGDLTKEEMKEKK